MIKEELKKLRDFTQERKFKKYRKHTDIDVRRQCKDAKMSMQKRSAHLLKTMCEMEEPIVFENEKIAFTRTIENIPSYYNERDIQKAFHPKTGTIYDTFHNACPNFDILLKEGLIGRLEIAKAGLKKTKNKNQKEFLESVIISIEAVIELAKKYAEKAKLENNGVIAEIMKRVPEFPANSFHEALQSLRFISSMFYLNNNYQLGFGRLDQYLYPYYKHDIDSKVITKENARDLLAEFFIALNRDTDLYFGVQQGDNGQTIMLGGIKTDGSSGINDLTYLILEVSRDLRLIDPKINLRVDSNTPNDLIELGCELTKQGLGFPQYSNDEVVIPALVKKGYSLEDARNYTVAACWEFIIPGGLEIVNQGALSFLAAVDNAFQKTIKYPVLFSMKRFRKEIRKDMSKQVKNILKKRDTRFLPSPFASIFFDGALESYTDASISTKYKNIGMHGAGAANAADALAVIKNYVERKDLKGLKQIQKACNRNFEGYEELQDKLLNEMPKVGNDDNFVDLELKFLFDTFADVTEKLSTKKHNIRPGSGSAMYYLWLTPKEPHWWLIEPAVGATAEGRSVGEPLSTSLAPTHGIKVSGVLSVLKSFSNIDYSRVMNGGPITIELAPSVLGSQEGIEKLAQLIKYFVQVGNQQLQLNVLDIATLEEAVLHPERHKNLIVRVWGWSGYFCELAPEYQNHIINRHKYSL